MINGPRHVKTFLRAYADSQTAKVQISLRVRGPIGTVAIRLQNYWILLTVWMESKGPDDTVDSRYLEFQETHWDTSRYPYLDISELREWGKQ